MKVKRLTAAILAAAITVSSIAPEAFAEIGGAGGTSTVNESTVDTSTDPASVGSDKTEEPGKTVSSSEPGEGEATIHIMRLTTALLRSRVIAAVQRILLSRLRSMGRV